MKVCKALPCAEAQGERHGRVQRRTGHAAHRMARRNETETDGQTVEVLAFRGEEGPFGALAAVESTTKANMKL